MSFIILLLPEITNCEQRVRWCAAGFSKHFRAGDDPAVELYRKSAVA
jgi:hypothetical protein